MTWRFKQPLCLVATLAFVPVLIALHVRPVTALGEGELLWATSKTLPDGEYGVYVFRGQSVGLLDEGSCVVAGWEYYPEELDPVGLLEKYSWDGSAEWTA